MGFSYRNREERLAHEANIRAARKAADEKRNNLASKIAMMTIDHINRIVVRPGPVAEERECYEMAQEIRDSDETLTDLISAILKVAKDEGEF
jgi:hypothetical protein